MTRNPEMSVSTTQHGMARRQKAEVPTKTRAELAQEFNALPSGALADTPQTAAFLNCSEALLERRRWDGTGIPFLKLGRSVRYRKSDVLAYLEDKTRTSTTKTA
jgi:hypothetical protein